MFNKSEEEDDERNLKNNLRLAQFYMILQLSKSLDHIGKLISACAVKNILRRGVDINYIIPNKSSFIENSKFLSGSTLLHIAAWEHNSELVNELLNQGAHFTIQNHEGQTPLHVTMNLSCKAQSCWKVKGKLQERPWIDSILAKQLATNKISNPRCKNGITHLHISCMVNNIEAVEFFLKIGESVNQAIDENSPYLPGYTPLHIAVRYSNLETAKILLNNGADMNLKDAKGLNPFYMLLERYAETSDVLNIGINGVSEEMENDLESMNSLIELFMKFKQMENSNIVDEFGLSSFHIACIIKNQSVAENLVKHVDINAAVYTNCPIFPGYTAGHFSARCQFKTMKLLLANKASILVKDANEITPMDLCIERYNHEALKWLISTQSDFDDKPLTAFGDSCIEDSSPGKDAHISDLISRMGDYGFSLKSYLYDVNISIPFYMNTWIDFRPLHLAVLLANRKKRMDSFYREIDYNFKHDSYEETDYIELIRTCLRDGCDVNLPASNGWTALHLAFYLKKETIVNELLNASYLSNSVDSNNLSHFHIACITNNKIAVEHFLQMGVDVNSPVKCNIEWFGEIFKNPGSNTVTLKSNSTPLHMAVVFTSKDIIKLLLDHGANRYAADEDGLTPIHKLIGLHVFYRNYISNLFFDKNLEDCVAEKFNFSLLHVACNCENKNNVENLLDKGADVNAIISTSFPGYFGGQSPLHIAIQSHKNVESVELLINRGANIYTKNAKGKSPLQLALEKSRKFLKPFTEKLKNENFVDDFGITSLHLACATYDLDWIKLLLENGVDVNAKIISDEEKCNWAGYTPLHALTENFQGDYDDFEAIVDLLVKNGADVTMTDAKGLTPLHMTHGSVSSYRGPTKLFAADILLKNQKSYNVNHVAYNGLSHFHLACIQNHTEVVEEFIKNNIDINETIDPFVNEIGGYTALHFAVSNKHVKLVKILIEHDADITIEDNIGNTPLHMIFQIVNLSVPISLIDLLISNGANMNAENMRGEKPLELFVHAENFEAQHAEYFRKRGYSFKLVNSITSEGYLAKSIMYDPNHLDPVKQPVFNEIIKSPDITDLDENGLNAIHNIVSYYGYHGISDENYAEVIEKLLDIGCELDQKDKKGRTALHLAIKFKNCSAIKGLLILGSDVNIIDEENKSPYVYAQELPDDVESTKEEILKILSSHIEKILQIGLHVSDLNKNTHYKICKEYDLCKKKQTCDVELRDVDKVRFNTRWSLKDFLLETGIIVHYPTMPDTLRQTIDNQFRLKSKLHERFPFYGRILMLQYRKALERFELLEPAMNAIIFLGKQIPEVCLHMILQYLSNDELRILIDIAGITI